MQTTQEPTVSREWERAKRIALRFDVTEQHVYRLYRTGKIPAIRVGKALRFNPAEVEAALSQP